MSLRNKLLVIFIVLSFFPVVVLGILSFRTSARIITEGEIAKQNQQLLSIQRDVREEVSRFQLAGIRFLLNDDVQGYIRLAGSGRSDELKKREFEISKLLHDYRIAKGTRSIALLLANGDVFANSPDWPRTLADYRKMAWFSGGLRKDNAYFWGEAEVRGEPIIPCVRALSFPYTDYWLPAYLVIEVKESVFHAIYDSFRDNRAVENCIVDAAGNILSHDRAEAVGKNFFERYGVARDTLNGISGSFTAGKGSARSIFTFVRDDRITWTLIRSIPVWSVTARVRSIRTTTILISVLCLVTGALIALLLSRNIILPIQRLIGAIRKSEAEITGVELAPASSNEILELSESFDMLMRQLKQAVEHSLTVGNEKRAAELRMLEYQINPHFLYNTLSTIIWLAYANNSKDVISVTSSLADFFRLSINRGSDFYTVRDEIQHVKSFLAIEAVRYPDEFSVTYEASPDVLDCQSIKLVLQPVAENAIQHGLQARCDRGGRILIRAERRERLLRYTVMDNGEEMQEQRAREISRALSTGSAEGADIGVGLRNVNERIKLVYGDTYGVSFERLDGWTCVHIAIPIQRVTP